RRTAATWVAATGAFLLVAAAGVFVSVRWDDIPDAGKLGILFALTGAALVAGQSLRRTLPATGDVLFHLGAFLLPVDLAALWVRMDGTWGALLTAEGLLCGAGFAVLAVRTDSAVLRRASIAGVVLLAAGLGAVTPVPAALLLAAFAVVAASTPDERTHEAAAWWAAVAGLAPALTALTRSLVTIGGGTLADLGFASHPLALTAWATGLASAAVLGWSARRRDEVGLAFLAIAVGIVGVTTSFASSEVSGDTGVIAIAGGFLVLELASLFLRRDAFWSRPVDVVATIAEVLAVPAIVLGTVGVLAFRGWFSEAQPELGFGLALVVAAGAWLAADLRWQPDTVLSLSMRLLRGGGRPFPNLAFAISIVSAVAVSTLAASPVVLATVVVAAALLACGRPLGTLVAAASVGMAVVAVPTEHAAVLAAVVVATAAAWLQAKEGGSDRAVVMAVIATLGSVLAGATWSGLAVVAMCWAVALVLETAQPKLGDVARAGLVVPVINALQLPVGAAVVATVACVVGALVIDALVFRRRDLATAAAVAAQILVFVSLEAAHVADPQAGLSLCVTAIVWAGLAAVVDGEWRDTFIVGAVSATGLGLALASTDAVAFADSLVIAGGLVATLGMVRRSEAIAHVGGAAIVAGIVLHLGVDGVQASEPYVLPVAVQLGIAGWHRRRQVFTSSWVAYAPSVALVGGTALVERIGGGSEWHVLVVAAVGTLAVAIGGWQRLVGPLLTGTALLVAITAHESLGALAGIPTWTWLAIAGTSLLGTGVALERTDTTPAEAGRRLVDVVGDRFE
ncbi:MAG: hypothetical protein QOD30_2277, partial [Actinomycetota bacterium]|nr:hypothetical protein [Actinomycetota bacterium]